MGFSPARGPVGGGHGLGPAPRAPVAAGARSREAATAAAAPAASAAHPGGLGRGRPAGRTDRQRVPGARVPPRLAMEGASFGAGRAGAALDPVSFARRPQTLLRVASWVSDPGPGPRPGLGSRLALHPTSLPANLAPRPSTPSLSPPAPPPPAAGWGDVTGLGAPTCGRGRGRWQPPGTLRGHRPPPPSSSSSLGVTQSPSSAPAPFFLSSRPGSGHRGGDGIGFEPSASARGGGYGSRVLPTGAYTCFSLTHTLQAPSRGAGPFPGPPGASVCVCVSARGVGVLWDPSGWGSKKGLCPGRASWGWCGRGRFGDSLDYWGIPRPGGLLLLLTSPGRRDEKVG